MSRTAKSADLAVQPDFNGAAVIDEQGNEIAITEDMVRQAINELDERAYAETEPASAHHKAQQRSH